MFGDNLDRIVKSIEKNYEADEIFFTKPGRRFPSRTAIKGLITELRRVLFPGYFGPEMLSPSTSPSYFIGQTLIDIESVLRQQLILALTYTSDDRDDLVGSGNHLCGGCTSDSICEQTADICTKFFDALPEIQRTLLTDVQALYDGDPAAGSKEEVIFTYPGLYAIYVYRIAHVLYDLGVPIIPRVMTEIAHSSTGIDIGAGAQIGEYFFIDHGTGASMLEEDATPLPDALVVEDRAAVQAQHGALHPRRPAPGRREAPPHHRGQRHHLLQRQCAGRRDGHRRGLGYRGLHLRDLLGAAPFPRLCERAGDPRPPARREGLIDSKQRRRIPNWRSWQSACGNGGHRPEASSLVSPLLLAAVGFYEVFEAFLGVFAGDAHAGKGLYRVAHLNAAVLDGEGAQYPSFFHVSTASPSPMFSRLRPSEANKNRELRREGLSGTLDLLWIEGREL